MINNTAKKILKALSFDGIEVEASRHLADLKKLDPMKIFYRTIDQKIYNGSHQVPVRIFFPNERAYEKNQADPEKILLFLHGGGWVTESIDNYERICARLANATNHFVVAVEYRLAPEHKFPAGLEDCYAAAKAVSSQCGPRECDSDRRQRGQQSGGGIVPAGAGPGRISAQAADPGLPGHLQRLFGKFPLPVGSGERDGLPADCGEDAGLSGSLCRKRGGQAESLLCALSGGGSA